MALAPLHQHHPYYLPISDGQQHLSNSGVWNSDYSTSPSASDQKPIGMLAPVSLQVSNNQQHIENSASLPSQDAYYALNNGHLESKYAYEFYQQHSFGPQSASDDDKDNSASKSCSDTPRTRKNGGSRRYKTPSPQLLRNRREAANARERKRMNSLNHAFDKLRTVLPEFEFGRRLSKYETLLMAQEYIGALNQLIHKPSSY